MLPKLGSWPEFGTWATVIGSWHILEITNFGGNSVLIKQLQQLLLLYCCLLGEAKLFTNMFMARPTQQAWAKHGMTTITHTCLCICLLFDGSHFECQYTISRFLLTKIHSKYVRLWPLTQDVNTIVSISVWHGECGSNCRICNWYVSFSIFLYWTCF